MVAAYDLLVDADKSPGSVAQALEVVRILLRLVEDLELLRPKTASRASEYVVVGLPLLLVIQRGTGIQRTHWSRLCRSTRFRHKPVFGCSGTHQR